MTNISSTIDIYTDGSCVKNPGLGGFAYIILYDETTEENGLPQTKEIDFNQGYRLTTNNRMEIMAAIFAIKKSIELKDSDPTWSNLRQINLYSDSEYMCNAINQRWINRWAENNWMTAAFGNKPPKAVKNQDLWEEIISVQRELHDRNINILFNHVKGHNGNEFNEKADKLAVAASNGTNHLIDEVYERTTGPTNRR